MSESKRDEVRNFAKRKARTALYERAGTMNNREQAEVIRQNVDQLASAVACEIADAYCFVELADIMEWKRTRVRR